MSPFGRAQFHRPGNDSLAVTPGRPRAAAWPAAMLGLLMSIGGAGAAAGCAPPAVTHQVAIDGVAYAPAAVTVHTGDTIVWTNKDPFPHTVTSKAGGFDSTAIQAGATWQYVAKTKGTFEYVCAFHPTMRATLDVR